MTVSGAEKGSNEGFLLGCLDRFSAVAGPYPCDSLAGRVPGQSGQWNPHALRAAGTGGLGVGIPRGRSQIDRLRSGGLVAAGRRYRPFS